MKPVVPVILGPTAVGKTSLSLFLARRLSARIISADSRQFYRFMNIGTAKPLPSELEQIPHHFIDILNPDESYSAGMFSKEARIKIISLIGDGIQPLIVGGSGLYIQALTTGFSGQALKDDAVRTQLEQEVSSKGLDGLYRELAEIDKPYQQKISPNDQKRILRALEVYRVSGRTFSECHAEQPEPAGFEPLFIGLTLPREMLVRKIDQRVREMFDLGLIGEVRALLDMGFSTELNALNTVGYKEIPDYLKGITTLEQTAELIRIHTRQYAKRQMTWFRKNRDIVWFDLSAPGFENKIFDFIYNRLALPA